MKWSQISAVTRKDFLEQKRSPFTLLLVTLIPGIVLPLLLLSGGDMATDVSSRMDSVACRLAVVGQSKIVSGAIARARKVELTGVREGKPHELISAGECDALLRIPPGFDDNLSKEAAPKLELFYDGRIEQSMLSVVAVSEALSRLKSSIALERIKTAGIKLNQPEFKFVDLDLASAGTSLNQKFASMYAFLVFFAVFIAVTSMACDLVTGERERGTLESLLVTPLERESIMTGKLLTVCAFGLFCALLTTTTFAGKLIVCKMVPVAPAHLLALLCITFPIVLLLVVTLSAILVLTCAYARSVQQATGFAFWVLVVMLLPAAAAASGEISLSSAAAFLPIGNLSVALVEVLRGRFDVLGLGLVFLASLLFAWVFVKPIPGLLASEEHLFNLEISPGARAAQGRWTQELVLLLSAVFLAMFYLSPLFVSWKPLVGLVLTQVVCVFLPAILFLRLVIKLPAADVVNLKFPGWRPLLGAAALSPFTVGVCSVIAAVQSLVLPAPEGFFKQLTNLVIPPGSPLVLVLLCAALSPGICEEFLFRGVFLGLLRRRMPALSLSFVVGAIFGIFHFSIFRFFPTFILGTGLTALSLYCDSIIPSMILHACHNGLSVVLTFYPWLSESPFVIACGVLVSFAGGWLLFGSRGKK